MNDFRGDLSAVEKLLKETETPFFVFNSSQIARNVAQFERLFTMPARPVEFFYSIKTNSCLEVASQIANRGWSLLASSEGDLDVARKARPLGLIFDAPAKTDAELETVSAFSNPVVVCENQRDFERVMRFAAASKLATLGLRVMIPRAVSGHSSRFGFELEQLTSGRIVERMQKLESRFSGLSLHFHLGGTPATVNRFRALAAFVTDAWKRLRTCGLEVQALSCGGGFPSGLSEIELKEYSNAVMTTLTDAGVPDSIKIWFEPGRAIAENTGILCVRVLDISIREGETFALVDGGSNLAMPAWMLGNRKRTIERLNNSDAGEQKSRGKVTIVGPLCAENDRLGEIDDMTGISVGDCLLIKDVGAYDWSTRFFFGRRMPLAFVVQSDGSCKAINNSL